MRQICVLVTILTSTLYEIFKHYSNINFSEILHFDPSSLLFVFFLIKKYKKNIFCLNLAKPYKKAFLKRWIQVLGARLLLSEKKSQLYT